MQGRRREVGIPLLLGAGAFALAFAQRPGLATADTKINLHVDPGRFLADVASMWTSTGQLGDVQAGQQAGYLFPMGPFFARRPRARHPRLGRPAPVAGHAAGARRVGRRPPARRAARTPARRRAPGRGRGHPAQPVRRHLRQPHHGDAAGLRGAAVAAAGRAPGPARVARLALAGGLRRCWSRPPGGGVNGAVTAWMLLGPGAAAALRARVTRIGWRAGARLRVARAADHAAHVAVVDRPRVRAVLLRDRLPALHRAAGHDLGHHQRDRDAAPDELLAVLRRDRLHRAGDPVLRRPAHAAVLAAGRDRDAAGARRSPWAASCGRADGATARSSWAWP